MRESALSQRSQTWTIAVISKMNERNDDEKPQRTNWRHAEARVDLIEIC